MPRRRLPGVGENARNLACRHRAPVEMQSQQDPSSGRMGQRGEHGLVGVQSRSGNSFRPSLQFPAIFSLLAEYCQAIFSIEAKYRMSQEMPPCGRSENVVVESSPRDPIAPAGMRAGPAGARSAARSVVKTDCPLAADAPRGIEVAHDRPTLEPRVARRSSSCSNVSLITSAAPVPAASRASFEG